MSLQIEQIQRDAAGRGAGPGANGGTRDVLAGRSSDGGGGGGFEILRAGKRGMVGDRAVMVEHTIL